MIIIAVDPGKTTGVAALSWRPDVSPDPELRQTHELQPDEFPDVVERLLDNALWLDTGLTVVCERFTINAQTVRNSQAPYSLEQIGVLKHLCRRANYPVDDVVFQSPADAKRMFPNEALRKLGYWHRGGGGHALDALRHGLLRAARVGWKPIRLLDS